MLNTQPQLSLGQIPRGIVAQVGPQVTSTSSTGVQIPQTATTMSVTGYDSSRMAYQYTQPNVRLVSVLRGAITARLLNCVCARALVHVCVRAYVCVHVCVRACVSVRVFVCMCVSVHVCVCMCVSVRVLDVDQLTAIY